MASEMSTADQSTAESTVSSSGGGADPSKSGNMKIVPAAIAIVVAFVVIIIGIVAASYGLAGGDDEVEEGASGGGNKDSGDAKSTGNVGKGPVGLPTTSGASTAKASGASTAGASGAPSKPKPTGLKMQRDIFCVVGERLVTSVIITSGSCDFVIYPDLAFVEDKFQAIHGRISWKVFDEAVKSGSKFIPGVSFLLTHASDAESTVGQIPKHYAKINELVASGLHALGFLSVPIQEGFSVDLLQRAYEVFDTAMSAVSTKTRRFIGVRMTSTDRFQPFAEDAKKLKSLDTIIIQVHNTGTIGFGEPCVIKQVSYLGIEAASGPVTTASYKRSENAIKIIKENGFNGNVILSSSVGVMIYEYTPTDKQPKFGDSCESAVLAHQGFACEIPNGNKVIVYDVTSTYFNGTNGKSYVSTTDDLIQKFKGKEFMKASNGLAIFDVEMDMYAECQNKKPGAMVALLADAARNP